MAALIRFFRLQWVRLCILALEYDIDSNEVYADQCLDGGIFCADDVASYRAGLGSIRVRLMVREKQRDELLAQRKGRS